MMELLGWALEQDSNYADILTPNNISESSQDKVLESIDPEIRRSQAHRPRSCTALVAT
jgi:hypothetical protein